MQYVLHYALFIEVIMHCTKCLQPISRADSFCAVCGTRTCFACFKCGQPMGDFDMFCCCCGASKRDMCSQSDYICPCGYRPDPKHKFCLKCGCPKIAETEQKTTEQEIEKVEAEPERAEIKPKKVVTATGKTVSTAKDAKTKPATEKKAEPISRKQAGRPKKEIKDTPKN